MFSPEPYMILWEIQPGGGMQGGRIKLKAGFCISLFFATAVCMADSAVMFEFPDGRTVAMISNGDITMAAESVSIVPSGGMIDYYDYEGWLPVMEVNCMFELVNNTGEEQYITVGFPFDAKFGDSYTAMDEDMLIEELSIVFQDQDRPPWQELDPTCGTDASEDIHENLDFRTFINGEEIPVYFRRCALVAEEELIRRPVVAVWKMKFEPYETVILRNTYNTSWDYFGGGPWSEFSVDYILTSGSTWSGPIGDAVIALEVPPDLPLPQLSDSISVYWDWEGSPVIDDRTVTWHYTDLEPTENLSFSVVREVKNHYDDYISPSSMFNEVIWTEEDLLFSASEHLRDASTWEPGYDTVLMIRILEALPYLLNEQPPPNNIDLSLFSTENFDHRVEMPEEHKAALNVAETVRASVERDIALIENAGYAEFLPLFTCKRNWDEEDLDRYQAYPGKQERFLDLLEYIEPAGEGQPIENPAVSAFYRLTGWYYPDTPLRMQLLPSETVTLYREMLSDD